MFADCALAIHSALCKLGFNAQITSNVIYSDPNYTNIILVPHYLYEGDLIRLNKNSIIVNAEQLPSWQFSEYHQFFFFKILYLASKCQVWDYNSKNIELFNKLGLNHVQHLQFGYVPELKRIDNNVEKTIDVLFYGSINERRRTILEKLKEHGLNVVSLAGVYGKELDQYIAQSKLVINIHHYEAEIFEIIRCFYLMNNGVAIISEVNPTTTIDQKELLEGIVGVPYDKLVDTCIELIQNPKKLEDLREKALSVIKQYPQEILIQSLVKKAE